MYFLLDLQAFLIILTGDIVYFTVQLAYGGEAVDTQPSDEGEHPKKLAILTLNNYKLYVVLSGMQDLLIHDNLDADFPFLQIEQLTLSYLVVFIHVLSFLGDQLFDLQREPVSAMIARE